MIPSSRLLRLAGMLLLPALLLFWWPNATPYWIAAFALLGLAATWDGWRVRALPIFEAEREVPAVLAIGAKARIRVRLRNPGPRRLKARVFDHAPRQCQILGQPATVVLAPNSRVEMDYELVPQQRGEARFGRTELRLTTDLGLVERRAFAGGERTLRVLPNFRLVSQWTLRATADSLGAAGRRVLRRPGGLEFRALRDYRDGDELRHIDWKATQRRGKPIAREYEPEKNQQVLFLIDCSRRLRARDGELAHFDAALNAVLLLSWVAVHQGDAVGLLTFGGAERWLAPEHGSGALQLVLDRLYDLESTTATPDFLATARTVLYRQSRRALVVVVTNLRDEDTDDVVPALTLLRRRHLVVLASLRETILHDALRRPIDSHADALRASAIHVYLEARRALGERLRVAGVRTFDVPPEQLAGAMVDQYLEVKRAGLL